MRAARGLARFALMSVAAVVLGGCGDESHSVETVVRAFADEGVPVAIGRESEGDSVLRAVLDPERAEHAGLFAVDVFRSAEDAQRFAANARAARGDSKMLIGRNVIIFYSQRAPAELRDRLTSVVVRLDE